MAVADQMAHVQVRTSAEAVRLERAPINDPLPTPPRGLFGSQESPPISVRPFRNWDFVGFPVEVARDNNSR
eukprot:2600429-Alexandrium_andersonii.AAC.1